MNPPADWEEHIAEAVRASMNDRLCDVKPRPLNHPEPDAPEFVEISRTITVRLTPPINHRTPQQREDHEQAYHDWFTRRFDRRLL